MAVLEVVFVSRNSSCEQSVRAAGSVPNLERTNCPQQTSIILLQTTWTNPTSTSRPYLGGHQTWDLQEEFSCLNHVRGNSKSTAVVSRIFCSYSNAWAPTRILSNLSFSGTCWPYGWSKTSVFVLFLGMGCNAMFAPSSRFPTHQVMNQLPSNHVRLWGH